MIACLFIPVRHDHLPNGLGLGAPVVAASARDVAVLGGGSARSPAARARRATSLASATEGLLLTTTPAAGTGHPHYLLTYLLAKRSRQSAQ